ncbi:MAG: BatD family protein [Paludibacter sp.]
MRNKLLLFSILLINTLSVFAQEPVRFTASAPSTVILDRPFQLVYTVNATGKDLRTSDFNNFEVLAGPFESRSSSYQIVNGKTSSSVSVSYTYTLQATKTGTFTIPSANITVDGKKYNSNGLSIKVLPADDNASSKSGKEESQTRSAAGQGINNDNVFIRANVSKTNVYEQEPILVTYKLYTLLDVVQCANKKMPDFKGFMKNEIELSQNKQFSYENFNGKNYGTVVLYQVLLFPQQAGELKIDKAVFDAVIRVENKQQMRSIFDDFFDSYSNVQKTISAPATVVRVNPLPTNKPANFNGTVGTLSLSSSISTQNIKANDAVTLKIIISGNGNLKLIQNPEIKFPDGFEVYDPKVNNNFKTNTNGISGTKIIEYMFIPRHGGDFQIPSTEIAYFDIKERKYKTLRTPIYNLKVQKGSGEGNSVVNSYVAKEDVKQLGSDIRFIVTSAFEVEKEKKPFFGSVFSWIIYIIPLIISLILFFVFQKQIRENANVSFVRNKKANKAAQKRLKIASKLLNEGKKDLFYEEVMKAVWNYLSDKLTIPVSSLTKENVVIELQNLGVEDDLIKKFIDILNTCEFARYAPNSGQQEMGNLYETTIKTISSLENNIRKA